jgi:cytochrome c553
MNKVVIWCFAWGLAVAFMTLSAGSATAAPKQSDLQFFERKIRPILVKACYECHSAKSKKLKGGLLLDSQVGWMDGGDSGAAIEPGEVDKSLMIQAVRWSDPDMKMPPKVKLSDQEIKDLERWVKIGAPDPRTGARKEVAGAAKPIDIEKGRAFWAFQPPKAHAVPKVKDASWARGDIDRFVLAKIEDAGLKPIGDADRRSLIRRASFDLIGLPPTTKDVQAFVNDKQPLDKAFTKVVDRLLASPRFGERWGRHWLDIARYAESTGMSRNYAYPYAWRYRDYVIDSFNADKPYNRFITEQLAGDLLAKNSKTDEQQKQELQVATGFLALGIKDLNQRDREQYTMDNIDEQIDTFSKSVLALTVACARCHDHKFDPIPTKDYYAVAGIFRSTQTLDGYKGRGGGGNKNYFQATNLISFGQSDKSGNANAYQAYQKKIAPLEAQAKRLQAQVKKQKKQKNKGKGAARQKQATQLQARLKQIGDQIKKLRANAPAAPPKAMGVAEGAKPVDSKVAIRGDVHKLGEQVPRGFVQVLNISGSPTIKSDESGRLQLAQWLTSSESAAGGLSSRVMVNRIWHHLFGRGLVRTVDNFGATGERPSHPQLLDHLAVRFVDQGWSVKKTIRSIMLSRVYQLSADHSKANYAKDPDNVLLWHATRRRLNVEAMRDAMMAVSGQLDLQRPKGSIVMNVRSGEIGRTINASNFQTNNNHRSVYLPILRQLTPQMFDTFDFAEPSNVKGRREITTVATQALFLMNSKFVRQQAEALAVRLFKAKGLDDAGRVKLAYETVLSRPPAAHETERILDYVSKEPGKSAGDNEGFINFCHALLASGEFRYLN